MIAEQIERPDIVSSLWRYIEKAVSGLLVPAAQYNGRPYLLNIKQRLASNPSFSESIKKHATKDTITSATASAAAPLFSDKNKIVCEYLLLFILILLTFIIHQSFYKQFRRKNFKKNLLKRGALLL
jgi:hypothetical protein